jgi:NADPH:quinone reductase-like Zn-dependent oxidoreductase
MLAAVFTEYGPVTNLSLSEVAIPEPDPEQVLVEVQAVGINDYELGLISGKPFIIRLFLGLRRPRINIPGCDIAGRVVKTGSKVTRWRPGDKVYGDLSGSGFGAYAQYACCAEDQLLPMPESLSYEQAAAIPQAAVLAMQGLAAGGGLRDGQSVLVNGAGGGVGYYGIQLAAQYDVEMDAVDSADKAEYLCGLGYAHCYDYQTQDYSRLGKRYDLILDTKTFKSPFACMRALKPGGTYATLGGSMLRILQMLLLAPFIKLFTGKRLRLVSLQPNWNLEHCNALIDKGELRSDALVCYPFEQTIQALHYYEAAKQKGKVVLSFAGDGRPDSSSTDPVEAAGQPDSDSERSVL